MYREGDIFMDDRIKNAINSFSSKLERAYDEGKQFQPDICNEIARHFSGTDIDFYDFWNKYEASDYYRDDDSINLRIVNALQDVIIQAFFLWNCEMFEPMIKQGDVYAELVRLNREQSIIIKTRVYWERIMNFCYLLIEGKELDSKRSKKKRFKEWAETKGFVFFEDILLLMEQYDNAFRTPEVHKFSRIRSAIVKDEKFTAIGYAFAIIVKFGTNVYPNILRILEGKDIYIRDWINIDGQLSAFTEMPDWVQEEAKKLGLKEGEIVPFIAKY